jgi:glyoxylase-like metal-dependent hydrolase (beta-lactamase superfamily II)
MTRSEVEIRYERCDDKICFIQLQFGGDRNFCYLLGDTSSGIAAAVDPGFNAGGFVDTAAARNLKIERILITHAHADHMGEAARLRGLTGAPIYAGSKENVPDALSLRDGEEVPLGKRSILSLHTPGHAPGHLCFLFERRLLTGDLLFCGKVGGTGSYFPNSSAVEEWESLKRIISLPGEILIFPGHDYYGGTGEMSYSSLDYEKEHNPFLLCKNFDEFLYLKNNWETYKYEHGIL